MKTDTKYTPYATSLYHALVDDAFYITMEASVDHPGVTPKQAMIQYMAYSMMEAGRFGELCLPEKEIHGASIWSKPMDHRTRTRQSREKKAFIEDVMGAKSLETYLAIVEFMSSKAVSVIDESCWYLSIVGIDPAFQGNGLGASLITPVLERTDRLNVPTYLETFTPGNMGFYERLGYGPAASFFEPVTQAEYWIMVRDPG